MNYIDKINSPSDLKKLKIDELKILSKDIRKFLVRSVSKTGGHLASNLGVVELTMALHYCYNSPKDKIIWDVGHQSYINKILTGRKSEFSTLRQFNGLSGFPKASESEHDHFDTGHSTTSISAAVGYAAARDLKGDNNRVVAVIGDGAMTGGMAYEAMNSAGRLKTNMIVILNDNQMSISENVGAISKNLNEIRTSMHYNKLKSGVRKNLKTMSHVGEKVENALEKTRDIFKYAVVEGKVFEDFGFKYIGPVDGHDIEELIHVLNRLDNIDGPILLHVHTKKGKGYKKAELAPTKFHGISSFDIKTGEILKKDGGEKYSDVFGKKILELAKNNKKIVGVSAAMIPGTGLSYLEREYPSRVIDVGIAESHAVTFCGGLAKDGIIPIFAVYSTFLQRGYDQIIHDVCIQNLHVIFAIDRGGIVGEDGETHQGVFDLSFLSHIPNMTILAPKNKYELEKMLEFAVDFQGPISIRYPRGNASLILEDKTSTIKYGKSETIFKGKDICIISVGSMMDTSLDVYNNLKNDGYDPTLVNVRFIKPVDDDLINSIKKYKFVCVIEDNMKIGGAGSLILNKVMEYGFKGTFKIFGYDDIFIKQGSVKELYVENKLDSISVYKTITSCINKAEKDGK